MRIHLEIDAENRKIPFDHLHLLVGTIHQWLGWNEEHGKVSLHSFSRIEGGLKLNESLIFDHPAQLFFSAFDSELIRKMVSGIQAGPEMFNGLKVREIIVQENPDLAERELFYTGSPIFIKRRNGGEIEHILYKDPRADQFLQETMQTKMKQVGLNDDSLVIQFNRSDERAGTKKITYKGVENRASWCSVIIKGKPETKQFAWNVGLGNSTGIGFGAIK